MAAHMVSYDLIRRKDYPELFEALQKFDYWHCLGSTWIIKSDKTAKQLADDLVQHMDADDKLIVATLTGSTAWTKSFSQQCQDWLRNNL